MKIISKNFDKNLNQDFLDYYLDIVKDNEKIKNYHNGCYYKFLKLMNIIFCKLYDPNYKDIDGNNLLHISIIYDLSYGWGEILNKTNIYDNNDPIYQKNKNGKTPIDLALTNNFGFIELFNSRFYKDKKFRSKILKRR